MLLMGEGVGMLRGEEGHSRLYKNCWQQNKQVNYKERCAKRGENPIVLLPAIWLATWGWLRKAGRIIIEGWSRAFGDSFISLSIVVVLVIALVVAALGIVTISWLLYSMLCAIHSAWCTKCERENNRISGRKAAHGLEIA